MGSKISIAPFNFSMSLLAMMVEKLKSSLPPIFKIGPADNIHSLTTYAVFPTKESDGRPTTTTSKGLLQLSVAKCAQSS